MFSEMKLWAQEMAKTSIEADSLPSRNLTCCRCMAIYNSSIRKMPDGGDAGVRGTRGGCANESARAELTAINPAWPKAALSPP